LNADIISTCEEPNIRFVFLKQNSTNLTQPFDVCFFRPLKIKWRKILSDWKTRNTRQTTLPKESFAPLLKQLCQELGMKDNPNIASGFKETGIVPLDRQRILRKLPDSDGRLQAAKDLASNAVLQHLQTTISWR